MYRAKVYQIMNFLWNGKSACPLKPINLINTIMLKHYPNIPVGVIDLYNFLP